MSENPQIAKTIHLYKDPETGNVYALDLTNTIHVPRNKFINFKPLNFDATIDPPDILDKENVDKVDQFDVKSGQTSDPLKVARHHAQMGSQWSFWEKNNAPGNEDATMIVDEDTD